MDSESKAVLRFWTAFLLVIMALSGLAYWGTLITRPMANELEEKARVKNPLVVRTQQDRALEILAAIQRLQREYPRLNEEGKSQSRTSIEALEGQLTMVLGTLTDDQIPPQVKAHRATPTSI